MAERSLANRLWYRIVQRVVQLVAVVVYRVRQTGHENIPSEGAVLIVCNHQSHFDPPLVGMATRRRLNYMARETLFRFTPLGWLMRTLDAFPIDQEGTGISGIKESLRRLKRGEMLLVFPEGTRSHDGEIARLRPGFTALAERSKAAIVPAAIEGAFAAWPRWRRFPGLGVIHVHFGSPILPEQIAACDERKLVAMVERRIRQCQAELRQHPVIAQRRKFRPSKLHSPR